MPSVISRSLDRSTPRSWYALAVLLFLYVLSLMDRQIIALMITPLRRDLGLTDVQVGLLEGFAFVIMYTMAAIPLGWAVDRFSRRFVIFAGLVVWSASCAGAGFALSFAALFASRVGVGIGEAALTPGAHSMLSDLFPRRQLSMALGVFVIGANIGVMVSYGLGGTLIHWLNAAGEIHLAGLGQFHPWQMAFLVAGLPGLILSWLLFTIAEPQRRYISKPNAAVIGPVVAFFRTRGRTLPLVIVGFAFNNLVGYTVLSWTPALLERKFGWHVGEIGPALGLVLGIAGVAGMLSSGLIGGHCFRRGIHDINVRMSALSMMLAAPVALIAFTAATPTMCLVFLAGTHFLCSLTVASAAAALQLIAPNELRGRLAATYVFVANLVGQGLGPVAVGFITEHILHNHMLVGYSLAVLVPVAAALGALFLRIGLGAYRHALGEAEGHERAGEHAGASALGEAAVITRRPKLAE